MVARICRNPAEFWLWRLFAFELRRRGYAARGWVLPGSSASVLHGRWPSCGVAEKARIGRDLFRSEDDPSAAKPATPLLSLRCVAMNPTQFWVQVAEQWQKAWADARGAGGGQRRRRLGG